MTTNTLLLTFP